jgi:uncharacterized protein (TIGR04255 family)
VASKQLQKAPLIEALLEAKWALESPAPGIKIDPHYKLLLGRLFERLQNRYPEHEPLSTSVIPDHLAAHTIQHRFRTAKGAWPLVQAGPGILTVNETDKYTWGGFERNAQEVFVKLFEAHPKPEELKVTNLLLRYINAIEFDYAQNNILNFLAKELKTNVSFLPALFQNNSVDLNPVKLDCHATFSSKDPMGVIRIRFASGHKGNIPALIWELVFETHQDDLPELPHGFAAWMNAAHQIIEDWFFKLIAGDLERRFSSNE